MQYYPEPMQRSSAQKVDEIRAFRQKKGMSQAALAQEIGVSQSTVSRRERKPPQKHSDASYRLCNYAETRTAEIKRLEKRAVQKSFDEVWNKSEAHAAALSKIIDAFTELCRREHSKGEDSG